jgi:hypothetical protein
MALQIGDIAPDFEGVHGESLISSAWSRATHPHAASREDFAPLGSVHMCPHALQR